MSRRIQLNYPSALKIPHGQYYIYAPWWKPLAKRGWIEVDQVGVLTTITWIPEGNFGFVPKARIVEIDPLGFITCSMVAVGKIWKVIYTKERDGEELYADACETLTWLLSKIRESRLMYGGIE